MSEIEAKRKKLLDYNDFRRIIIFDETNGDSPIGWKLKNLSKVHNIKYVISAKELKQSLEDKKA